MSTSHNIGPPPGSIMSYLGSSDPDGWVLCDGVARTDNSDSRYNKLNTLGIGSGGSGTSNYTPPDLRGKFLYSATSTGSTLLTTGGATSFTIATANLPSHTHSGTTASGGSTSHTHTATVTDPQHTHSGTTASGGSTSHTHTATVTDPQHTHTGTTASGGQTAHTHTATSTDAGHSHYFPNDHGHDDYNFTSATATTGSDTSSQGSDNLYVSTGKASITTTVAAADISHTHTFTTGSSATGITVANAAVDISHTHTITTGQSATGITVANTSVDISHTHTFTTDSTGQGQALSYMPPYTTVNYIIKY